MRTARAVSALLIGAVLLSGCASRTATGGAIGTAAGGAIGAVIGKQAGNTAVGAIIGAAVGGATGAAIGNYMDRQAAELRRDLAGAEVERVGEGIRITLSSGILFDRGSAMLRPEAEGELQDLARVLKKYENTNILLVGHTDSTGSEEYNERLSERRATSVSDYLKLQGVRGARISVVGRGEAQPVANNATASGRRQNRRVEVAIFANERLKRAAERGEIGEVSLGN